MHETGDPQLLVVLWKIERSIRLVDWSYCGCAFTSFPRFFSGGADDLLSSASCSQSQTLIDKSSLPDRLKEHPNYFTLGLSDSDERLYRISEYLQDFDSEFSRLRDP